MKIKVGRLVSLSNALSEVRGQLIGKQAAKALYDLRKKLGEMQEFYMEQLQELTAKMGLEITPELTVEFGDDTAKKDEFIAAVREIEAIEMDIGDPVDLTDQDLQISEGFVEATDGVILL